MTTKAASRVEPMSKMSAREFNQRVSAAKRAATEEGPVVVTDRGEATHVLMSYDDYVRAMNAKFNLVAWLTMEDEDVDRDDDFVFDPAPLNLGLQIPEF